MRNIKLTECEVDGINLFMSELITLPVVEAVYLLPYKTKIFGKYGVDVVTVYNNSLKYDTLVTGTNEKRDSSSELESLQETISDYGKIFAEGRLRFFAEDAADFLPFIFKSREILAKRSLASGIILFDRFGDIEAKQHEAQTTVGLLPNTVEISNLDSIKQGKELVSEYKKKND